MIDFCQPQQAAKSQRNHDAGHSDALRLPSELQVDRRRQSDVVVHSFQFNVNMTMVGEGLMPYINIKETSQATQINHNKIFRGRRLGRLLNMLY
jgi:hypothetical protein